MNRKSVYVEGYSRACTTYVLGCPERPVELPILCLFNFLLTGNFHPAIILFMYRDGYRSLHYDRFLWLVFPLSVIDNVSS